MKCMIQATVLLTVAAHAQETIDIYRDNNFGVPHVIAQTDLGAYFGAGYATAADRWYQMCTARLYYEGRTAEFFANGDVPHDGALVSYDKYVRVLGLRRSAAVRAVKLDAETRSMLQAYAAGVNKFRDEYLNQPGTHPQDPNFTARPVDDREWSIEDCIGVWLRLGANFQSFGSDEWGSRVNFDNAPNPSPPNIWQAVFPLRICNDGDATVRPADMATANTALIQFATRFGIPWKGTHPGMEFATCTLGIETPPAFSEAAVVHGNRTESGEQVLIGAPRIRVTYPNWLYEWHMQGATFNVRGVGVPGCPNVLFGSTETLAWSGTALSLDMTDVFVFTRGQGSNAGKYEWGPSFIDYRLDEKETILVKNQAPEEVDIQWTELGPVVDGLDDNQIVRIDQTSFPSHLGLTIKSVLHELPDMEAATAMLRMYRATTLDGFRRATEKWTFPSVNLVFAHATEGIGYTTVGAMPVRRSIHVPNSIEAEMAGRVALDAKPENDWQPIYVPQDLKPHAINPTQDYLASANNMPVGTWYPLFSLVANVGGNGRYRRLVELCESVNATPTSFLRRFVSDAIASNPRDVVLVAEAMNQQTAFPSGSNEALALPHLVAWHNSGASMAADHYGVALASRLRAAEMPDLTLIQNGTVILDAFGSDNVGMTLFLDAMLNKIGQPGATFSVEEQAVVRWILSDGWSNLAAALSDPLCPGYDITDVITWLDYYLDKQLSRTLVYQGTYEIADPFADPAITLAYGPVVVNHGATIGDVKQASFNQVVVPGSDADTRSMLAIGISGIPGHPHEKSQQTLWQNGTLKKSPILGVPGSLPGGYTLIQVVRP